LKNNLMLFYQVQLIDRHIDKLEEQRGDLPLTVEALEAKLENLKVAVDEKAALKIEWIEKRKVIPKK
jgi:predicted  nucleic acid-binding Zn-ribbon protein